MSVLLGQADCFEGFGLLLEQPKASDLPFSTVYTNALLATTPAPLGFSPAHMLALRPTPH